MGLIDFLIVVVVCMVVAWGAVWVLGYFVPGIRR